jgi:hypothetical protein
MVATSREAKLKMPGTLPTNSEASRPIKITVEDCKAKALECLRLRNLAKMSDRRTAMLLDMMSSWIALANQIEKYEAATKEET